MALGISPCFFPLGVFFLILEASSQLSKPPLIPTLDLVDGNRMPMAGLGMCCRESAKGDAARKAVADYLRLGGKMIDTAHIYGNHKEIGAGIQDYIEEMVAKEFGDVEGDATGSGKQHYNADDPNTIVARNALRSSLRRSIFIVSKIWHPDFGYENTYKASLRLLSELGLDYIDLVLLHVAGAQWPAEDDPECAVDSTFQSWAIQGGYSVAAQGGFPGSPEGKRNWEFCRYGSWAALGQLKDRGMIRYMGMMRYIEDYGDDTALKDRERIRYER